MAGRLLLIVWILILTNPAHSAVRTVGHTAGFDYKTITNAMAAASAGDQIRVAMGTYSADNPEYPETFPIVLKAGVTLIRNSEDIFPVIDANGTAQILICEDAPGTLTTRIEGFKFTGGYLASIPEVAGGALFLRNATLTVDSCEFSENVSENAGGAIGLAPYSDLELLDCIFRNNSSSSFGGAIFLSQATLNAEACSFECNQAPSSGGAIHNRYASMTVFNCQFTANSTNGVGGAIYCGYAQVDDKVTIEHSLFNGNSAVEDGAGIYLTHINELTPLIVYCTFNANSAQDSGGCLYSNEANFLMAFNYLSANHAGFGGAGVYCDAATAACICCKFVQNDATTGAGSYIDNSTVQWLNCLFDFNDADEFGAGVYGIGSDLTITNATFSRNHAADAAGAVALNTSNLIMRNSILWNNSISEIHKFESTIDAMNCDIMGGYPGSGNIDSDPLFVSGLNGSFYLSNMYSGQGENSPCVDSGDRPSSQISFTHEENTFALSDSSTRTDRFDDTGTADMGFHYYHDRNECCTTGCSVIMPGTEYEPGDVCFVDVLVCNSSDETFQDVPVFVILDIAGYYLFAPEFDDFSYYRMDVHPGVQYIHVTPIFIWPNGAGSASGINWYAAMTNQDITALFGEMGMASFSWHP